VGTGTGVLALLLARAGARVTATDVDPRAVASARDDAARLGLSSRVEVVEADLFPPGRARLVVANPPWVPGEPHGALDRAVYDPGGQVLERLLSGLPEHLDDRGEAWLILSDLAERLGLRAEGEIEARLASARLRVIGLHRTNPTHARARGGGRRKASSDRIAAARAAETTRLYVLRLEEPARS
jgi:tRNA1(Val) A37 N6-methylase TrmN6